MKESVCFDSYLLKILLELSFEDILPNFKSKHHGPRIMYIQSGTYSGFDVCVVVSAIQDA